LNELLELLYLEKSNILRKIQLIKWNELSIVILKGVFDTIETLKKMEGV